MKQKKFINIIIILFIVILISVSGYFILQQKNTQQPQEFFPEQSPETEASPSDSVDNFQETTINSGQQDSPKEPTEAVKPKPETSRNISFDNLYPPTPSSFGCNPYGGVYETQQGKIIQTYDQWKTLYNELTKNCYTKTDAPQIINFDEQTMIAVFAGSSCEATEINVETISSKDDKIIVRNVVSVSGCTLPSITYPFTLVVIDKIDLPVEFTFE